MDAIIQRTIEHGDIPGAVVLIGHDGKIVYRHAYGYRALRPRREAMTADAIFDMASLTKVLATAPSVMRLQQLGQIRLNDPVSKYVPEFGSNGKDQVTIRQLLTHFSGLPPDLELSTPWTGRETGYALANNETLIYPPGSEYVYSDINFIVLGELVERVTGEPLEKYAQENFYQPLKMEHTRFLPPAEWVPQIAPTNDEHGSMFRGVVHDPTSRRMGGVAGHAGLFSTADDVAKFAQAMLDGDKILSPEIIEKMTTPQQPANATVLRGLGWDIDSPYSTNRGELLPIGSYGHTGYTGTSLWIDPYTKTYIILLTNTVHPTGHGNAVSLRTEVATAAADILKLKVKDSDERKFEGITGYNETLAGYRRLAARNGSVLTGIDVLEQQDFAQLKRNDPGAPLKIGLLTNQSGVDLMGRRDIDVLAQAPGVKLAAIFSPEHGVSGTIEAEQIGNSVDPATHAPIYSVYGGSDAERHPPIEVLRNLDAIIIDLQDAGARFYTYETTMGYFLEAAARAGIAVYVLDRPNPITGSVVQGPMSQPQHASFVMYHPLPVRHGMTMGELAELFNNERGIHAKLTVIQMQGWMRGDWFDSTNLMWVNPSPNLRNLSEAILYPGVALVEGTNVSVGRGTDTPFELLGAPWIQSRQFADYLNRRNIAGIRFVPVNFTPESGTYAHQQCGGVNLVLTDRQTLDSPELGLELAAALRTLYPNDYKIDKIIELVGNDQAFQELLAGIDPRRITAEIDEDLARFDAIRQKFLLYH